MPDLSVTVEGVDRLIAKLGRATAVQTLRAPVWRAGARLLKAFKTYPPERSGSTYIRTNHLADTWAIVPQTGAALSVANSASYGPFVQRDSSEPDPHQAWMHMGRWPTDMELVATERPLFEADLEHTIDAALSG